MASLSPVPYTGPAVAIVGPTACGKTRRAVEVAGMAGGEIISADSRQVYRHMDIGTGKDLEEYGKIAYHLIDVREAGDRYNLHQYLRDFRTAYDQIRSRGNVPVICGGTGMYVENAVRGIVLPEVPEDPALRERLKAYQLDELAEILAGYKELHNITDIDTKARAIRAIEIQEYYRQHPEKAVEASYAGARPLDCVVVGLDIPRESRRSRITARLRQRLDEGMVDEIMNILDSGVPADDLIYYGLEYKYVTLHVIGKLSYREMFSQLETAIHQFAKRQMTWFRGMVKRGTTIHWLPYDMPTDLFLEEVAKLMKS